MKKLIKKIGIGIVSLLAVVTAGLGFSQIAKPAVADAQATGLTQATLTRVDMTGAGTASNVEFIEFDGFAGDTFFLVEYEGRNAPNFAVNATKGYDVWKGETINLTGSLLFNSHYNGTNSGSYSKLEFCSGFEQGAYMSKVFSGGGLSAEAPVGQKNVMIVGVDVNENKNEQTIYYYIFTFDANGNMTELVKSEESTFWLKAQGGGKKAVIYPNVNYAVQSTGNPEEITFQYAQPATTIDKLIAGLGEDCEYKQYLQDNHFDLFGLKKATLERMADTEPTNTSVAPTCKEFIEFDNLAGDTFFLVDFMGSNVPNFAINAQQGYNTLDVSKATADAGLLLFPSTAPNRWANLYILNGFKDGLTSFWKSNEFENGGLHDARDLAKRYIWIVGVDEDINGTNNDRVYFYNFEVSPVFGATSASLTKIENGTKGDYLDLGLSLGSGSKAVIYPNYPFATTSANCLPEITFQYAQPKTSIEELLLGLSDTYEYKKLLLEEFEITTNKVTVKSEEGKTVATKSVKTGEYTLPTRTTDGFIGWKIEDGLYEAGSSYTVNKDVVIQETCVKMRMKEGASVRLTDDRASQGYYGGMRFAVCVDKEQIDSLEAWIGADKVQINGLVIPKELLGNATLNKDTANANDKVLTKRMEDTETGEYVYFITLTNIKYVNLTRDYSATAYLSVAFENETEKSVVQETEVQTRSVYTVAKKAVDDPANAALSDTYKKVLNGYVNYTVTVDENFEIADTTHCEYTLRQEGSTVTITFGANFPEFYCGAERISILQQGVRLVYDAVWEGNVATVTLPQA